MSDKIEKLLNLIADTENITPDDNLSRYLSKYVVELSEMDLDYVSAAAQSDYNRLLEHIKKNDK